MSQIDFQVLLAEEFFNARRHRDLDLSGTQRKGFVAPSGANPELHPRPNSQNRIKMLMNALLHQRTDLLHVGTAFKRRRERFQTRTAVKPLPNRLEFLLRECGSILLADVDSPPHPLEKNVFQRRTLIFHVVHEFFFKHRTVVAFRGDLVVPADNRFIH